jgi:DNA-binding MarR family transcriptional regulator
VSERAWQGLAALHACVEAELEQALARSVGLSVVEYRVLDAVGAPDAHPLRMQVASEVAVLTGSATTRLVNRLEERQLVRRGPSPDDRRGVALELTEAGRLLLDRARPVHAAAIERAFALARSSPGLAPFARALLEAPDPGGPDGRTRR